MSLDIDTYVGRSRALDLSDIDWSEVGRHPISTHARRTLRYMQDIESYTIMYLHELLSTRIVDDPKVTTFLACWLYEETFHGRALARFLEAAGETVITSPRSQLLWSQRLEHLATGIVARLWSDFSAVHMTWGAINELTTLTGYRMLSARAGHPMLSALLSRIMRDESRHFHFYFEQAQQRLANPRTARITRFVVDHFWAPVGAGVQPREETRFLATYLFGDAEGRLAAQRVDETIRRLPGFADAELLEAWVARHCTSEPSTVIPACAGMARTKVLPANSPGLPA